MIDHFEVHIPASRVEDVIERVQKYKPPRLCANAGWSLGVDSEFFKNLIAYWKDGYNWQNCEECLAGYVHRITHINGRRIHFVHLSPGRGVPIMLLHGWPYSFLTMLPLAERLSQDFEVIVPSLPGFGLSEPMANKADSVCQLAKTVNTLMSEKLGFKQYVVHGGDVGAEIGDWIAVDQPESLLGLHTHFLHLRHHGAVMGSGLTGVSNADKEEMEFVSREASALVNEGAYYNLQITKPESIAYALSDSPVGWAAYMIDKWHSWSDLGQNDIEALYGMDRLLNEAMLYLLTGSVSTSLWVYPGYASGAVTLGPGQMIDVPYGFSAFPDPLIPPPPKQFAARSRSNIRFWREHNAGGHFPMLEQTSVLAKDIKDFVTTVS
ncbi:MAG: epoxide hydrolase [Desulfobacterales bacterium]|nr:epoxide hydrolase [Desulfobacterales bacterium]